MITNRTSSIYVARKIHVRAEYTELILATAIISRKMKKKGTKTTVLLDKNQTTSSPP